MTQALLERLDVLVAEQDGPAIPSRPRLPCRLKATTNFPAAGGARRDPIGSYTCAATIHARAALASPQVKTRTMPGNKKPNA